MMNWRDLPTPRGERPSWACPQCWTGGGEPWAAGFPTSRYGTNDWTGIRCGHTWTEPVLESQVRQYSEGDALAEPVLYE